uniref:Small capsomere-interacting protein n=1 Tax=Human herpesvirus 3 TaxID=10335 RepID=U5NQG6_HHV3|nr:ORF23 [Human alphaherpesvirus 3]
MTQPASSRVVFDPSNPTTFSVEAIAAYTPVALIRLLNASGPLQPGHRVDIADARSIYTVGAAASAARARANHNANTIRRTAMFAETDPMTWLRPTVGLKRTFNPRIIRPQPPNPSMSLGISGPTILPQKTQSADRSALQQPAALAFSGSSPQHPPPQTTSASVGQQQHVVSGSSGQQPQQGAQSSTVQPTTGSPPAAQGVPQSTPPPTQNTPQGGKGQTLSHTGQSGNASRSRRV